jgi:oligoribonuclease NrnB/cAMP/cGMP phosphodiesterase (DHH superfamily)
MERTLIFYHGGCPDGFGGAYSAWKKFGDAAEYFPMSYGKEFEESVAGADVYFIDFCYAQEVMDRIASEAKSLTVLDHHEGTEEVVRSMPAFVYDVNRSGASIAWAYFHPDTPLPTLLAHVEDDDLFRFKLADTRPVITYLTARPFSFEAWDRMVEALAGDSSRKELLVVANAYAEYFELLANMAVDNAKLVEFEGYEVYFATAHPLKPMKSLVGNLLAKKQGPFALVVTAHPQGYGVSIRGDGSIDVAAIAAKYGGNGHISSAGFAIPADKPLPWKKLVKEDENPGN